jgi:hypothetical protein
MELRYRHGCTLECRNLGTSVQLILLCILAVLASAATVDGVHGKPDSLFSRFSFEELHNVFGKEPHAARHKPIWPLNVADALVLLGASAVVFLAAGAGIGGGSVLVPLYLLGGGTCRPNPAPHQNMHLMHLRHPL